MIAGEYPAPETGFRRAMTTTVEPNWRDARAYAFCDSLSREAWAWQFLRRNPDYRHEWKIFRSTWRALEADYGAPPDRDFQAWQRDPRAYVTVGLDEAAGDCRVDEDRVLIECALGARWGFYKFPLDPDTERPVIGEQLTWREVPQDVIVVHAEDDAYLSDDPARIALGFDLDLPLRDQLERAKRHLLATQRGRVRDGRVHMRSIIALAGDWRRYLRCLDGLAAGADPGELGEVLDRTAAEIEVDSREARRLRDGGYREILTVPE